jgi:exosome complex component RRP43
MCYQKAPRVPLQLSSCVPISSSFGIFDSSVLSILVVSFLTTNFPRKLIFADPTSFEEPLLNTTISVVLGNDNHIMLVSQLGPAVLSIDDEEDGEKRDALPECIERAKLRRKGLVGTLFW